MSLLVIDASVVIKWVTPEAGTNEALRLRQHQLAAPDLLIAECANILWKKVRRGELTAEQGQFAARLLERCDIELFPTRRLLARAVELAVELAHPAYDCVYIALAEHVDGDFITADARLQRRVANLLSRPKVVLLGASLA